MALGSKIDNRIYPVLPYDFFYKRTVTDVALNKFVIGIVQKSCEIIEIAGVGKLVEINDETVRMLRKHHSDKIASYKSGTTCNKKPLHNCFSPIRKRSNGPCQCSIGSPSRALILLQSNRLFKGLSAAVTKSPVLHGNRLTSNETLSNINFAAS